MHVCDVPMPLMPLVASVEPLVRSDGPSFWYLHLSRVCRLHPELPVPLAPHAICNSDGSAAR